MNARRYRVFAILMSIALLAPAGVTVTAAQAPHAPASAVAPARASRVGLSKHSPADFSSSLTATTAITPCVQPPDGLVSWWPGDGNANDIWDGNNGTLENGATFADGMVGQAFSFDGADDYVNIPDSSNLDLATYTFEAWIYISGTVSDYKDILGKGYGYGNDPENYYLGVYSDGSLLHASNTGGTRWYFWTPPNSVPFGTWVHVAGSFDGNVAKTYVNGVMLASLAVSGVPETDNYPLDIGYRPDNYPQFHFPGRIDEVSLYNRALTDSEVKAIYDAGSAGKCMDILTDMHVASIDPSYLPVGNLYRVRAGVTIQSGSGSPVSGADVTLDVTLPGGSDVTMRKTTDISGTVSVQTTSSTTGTYTFTVTDVSQSGWTYDSSQNVETSDSVLVPTDMHVASIDPSYQPLGSQYRVSSGITIQNQNDAPLSGTLVTVAVTMPDGSFISKQGTTDSSGTTTVSLISSSTGTYTFKVVGVREPPWTYDRSQNVETTDRITIP